MPTGQLNRVLDRLRLDAADTTDGQLLGRYVARRDETCHNEDNLAYSIELSARTSRD